MIDRTHIALRIPGFCARVERRLQGLPDDVPLVVCAGEDDRALVLSACERAIALGARPGMRIGSLRQFDVEVVRAHAARYASAERELAGVLARELPDVQCVRAGVFRAVWSRGRRFLVDALRRADARVAGAGFGGAWGVGPGDAVAEIAAAVAPVGETVTVPPDGTSALLAPLPLRLLPDLSEADLAALAEIGVRRFRQLLALPDEVLRSLFGPEGPGLRRIALHGSRGPSPRQWRGRRRFAQDTAELDDVRRALAELVSDGFTHVLGALGQTPRRMRVTLVYADDRSAGAVIASRRAEHEGSWQTLARAQVPELWTRRARIAGLRLAVDWGVPPSQQLSLFVAPRRQFRDRRLTRAVGRVRDRWGRELVRYASAG